MKTEFIQVNHYDGTKSLVALDQIIQVRSEPGATGSHIHMKDGRSTLVKESVDSIAEVIDRDLYT